MTTSNRTFDGSSTAEDVVKDLDLSNQTFLVTGTSSGLGLETLRVLAKVGKATVISCVRTRSKLEKLCKDNEIPSDKHHIYEMDLSDLESVKKAAQEIASKHDSIDAMILNAGIMYPAETRQTTKQGHEMHFGVNYLAHACIAKILVPKIKKNGRFVWTSSLASGWGAVDLDDLEREKNWSNKVAYGASSSARCTYIVEFHRRFHKETGIDAFSLHPGVIGTGLQKNFSADTWSSMGIKDSGKMESNSFMTTIPKGAATQVWAATAPELSGKGGVFLTKCNIVENYKGCADGIMDEEKGKKLWEITEKLIA